MQNLEDLILVYHTKKCPYFYYRYLFNNLAHALRGILYKIMAFERLPYATGGILLRMVWSRCRLKLRLTFQSQCYWASIWLSARSFMPCGRSYATGITNRQPHDDCMKTLDVPVAPATTLRDIIRPVGFMGRFFSPQRSCVLRMQRLHVCLPPTLWDKNSQSY